MSVESLSTERELHYIFGKKLAEFGLAIDEMRLGDIENVFAEDVVGEYGGVVNHTTREQFIAAVEENLGQGSNCGTKQHNILNLQVLEHGQSNAVTRCNFYAVHQGINRFSGCLWKTWGEYRDTWSLTAQGWRITHRKYTTYFNEGPDGVNTRD